MPMVIYNFESVFNIERRMHKIDPSRGGDQGLNQIVPLGGVPIRGITYVSVIILVVLILWRLPLSGSVIGVFPWYFHLFLAMMIAKLRSSSRETRKTRPRRARAAVEVGPSASNSSAIFLVRGPT